MQSRTNKQSVAAIQLGNGGVTVSGMCLSLGKSLPSLGHLNQKGLLPRINGCACVLQTPNSLSLAISCDRHLSSPNQRMKQVLFEDAACERSRNGIRLDNSRAPRFGLRKVSGLKPRFRSL